MTTNRLVITAEVDGHNGISIGDAADHIIKAMQDLKKQGYSGRDLSELSPNCGVIEDHDGDVIGEWRFEQI